MKVNPELSIQLLQVVMGLYETAVRLQKEGMSEEAKYVIAKVHDLFQEIFMKELGKATFEK